MAVIRQLPDGLVNQIAAGEVIERPASALREVIENALDAGAGKISITLRRGGIDELTVADDGHGMTPDDMLLAIQRHATSKLPDDNLNHIGSLGFRGEALPSIGSVSHLKLTSVMAGMPHAWCQKRRRSRNSPRGGASTCDAVPTCDVAPTCVACWCATRRARAVRLLDRPSRPIR